MMPHIACWIGLGGLLVAFVGMLVSEIRLRRQARRMFQINPLFEHGKHRETSKP